VEKQKLKAEGHQTNCTLTAFQVGGVEKMAKTDGKFFCENFWLIGLIFSPLNHQNQDRLPLHRPQTTS
jgi:hypothetical protein